MTPQVALHVAPHPDDELLGAPATLFALRDAGLRIVNLACSLGRPSQWERRRAEVEEACRRARFTLSVPDPPVDLSSDDDLAAAEARTTDEVTRLLNELRPSYIVAPSPHDGHHGHEAVGRAVLYALEASSRPPVWLAWELWGMLPLPTLLVTYDQARLHEIDSALSAHAGELARVDYRRAITYRGGLTALMGSERVFGYGTPAVRAPYAEVTCELHFRAREWWAGTSRTLAAAEPLAAEPSDRPLGWWLHDPSFRERMRQHES